MGVVWTAVMYWSQNIIKGVHKVITERSGTGNVVELLTALGMFKLVIQKRAKKNITVVIYVSYLIS